MWVCGCGCVCFAMFFFCLFVCFFTLDCSVRVSKKRFTEQIDGETKFIMKTKRKQKTNQNNDLHNGTASVPSFHGMVGLLTSNIRVRSIVWNFPGLVFLIVSTS